MVSHEMWDFMQKIIQTSEMVVYEIHGGTFKVTLTFTVCVNPYHALRKSFVVMLRIGMMLQQFIHYSIREPPFPRIKAV